MSMILLNPGPVTLSPRVRAALMREDICHREPEFAALQDDVRDRLLEVYSLDSAEWCVVLLAGSGTAANEAMLTSLVPKDGNLLVMENGAYGERLRDMAAAHGIAHQSLRHEWGAPIDMDRVRSALEDDSSITHVAVVHHETTTGRLNGIAALGDLCAERGVHMLVDTVSSLGAEAIEFDNKALCACAATANKCLHGAPGVSFVVVRREALGQSPARSVYLDLMRYAAAQDAHSTPFTQPVHVMYALQEALRELADEGGWRQRQAQYQRYARTVREALIDLDIEPLMNESQTSVVLSAYRLPKGISYSELHDELKQHGFVIYAGQGEFARTIFRISTMGAITDADIDRLVDALRQTLKAHAVRA